MTCFGLTAELVAEHTDKGHLIAIEGRITSGKYTKDAGETVCTLDIIANRVEFLSQPKPATTTPDRVEVDDETEAAYGHPFHTASALAVNVGGVRVHHLVR